jgi:hypothetical protein
MLFFNCISTSEVSFQIISGKTQLAQVSSPVPSLLLLSNPVAFQYTRLVTCRQWKPNHKPTPHSSGAAFFQRKKFRWTVLSSKGTNVKKAGVSRIIDLERPGGFVVLPGAMYITGTATETIPRCCNFFIQCCNSVKALPMPRLPSCMFPVHHPTFYWSLLYCCCCCWWWWRSVTMVVC